jgi:peptidoglycan hydrolase-like protein with peptidoglycan-binding domain
MLRYAPRPAPAPAILPGPRVIARMAPRMQPPQAQPPAPMPRTVPKDAMAGMLQRAVAGRVLARAELLTAQQKQTAISEAKGRFDNIAIRALQMSVRTTSDGDFGPKSAEAVADFQQKTMGNTHPIDGIVDERTLNSIVGVNHSVGGFDADVRTLPIVTSFYKLDMQDVLSLLPREDAGLSTMHAESGGLRVIRINQSSFTGAQALRNAIYAMLVAPTAAPGTPKAAPKILTASKASSAATFNTSKLRDRRSVIAIQSMLGNALTGTFDAETSQRVAAFQQTWDEDDLDVDGKIGPRTLRALGTRALGIEPTQNIPHDALLRIIIDFYKLDQTDMVNISYDPTPRGLNANTSNIADGPSEVWIGPAGFAQTWEELVHTVAHELEHVRQTRVGITGENVREFLGERIEILSKGMFEEDFVGFADDITRALALWKSMTPEQQRAHWKEFEEVRNKVRARFAAASWDEREEHEDLLSGYDALSKP